MFKLYCFGGQKHFGTKADVINLQDFMDYFAKTFSLEAKVAEDAMNDLYLKQLTNRAGYLTCFWDIPSQLHHRDVMRFLFGRVLKSIELYAVGIENQKASLAQRPWIHNYGQFRDGLKALSDKAESAQLSLMMALDELSEAKVASSTPLGDTARKMIGVSQGYVLYSEDPKNADSLWKSRIYKVKLESKITKDQRAYGVMPSSEETQRNIQHFIDSLESVEFKTNRINLPQSHVIPATDIPAVSVEICKNHDICNYNNAKRTTLRTQYDSFD
jgi:hypothetical protein